MQKIDIIVGVINKNYFVDEIMYRTTYMWARDTSSSSTPITDGDEKFFIERFKLINYNSK